MKEIEDGEERIKLIADDYVSSINTKGIKRNALVISPTHAEGGRVTKAIRERLKKSGEIKGEAKDFITLKNLQFTEAQKSSASSFKAGQVIVYHQNAKGVKAGTRLTVEAANNDDVTAIDKTGNRHVIDLSKAERFSVFEEGRLKIAKGDRIRITANGKAEDGKHLFNGIAYGIEGFDKAGNIKLSDGSVILKDYGHLNYGYVMTSHSAQGKTTDKIIISQSSATMRAASMEQFYVSVSRGKSDVVIYTDDKEALLQAVKNSVRRLSAGELLEKIDKARKADEHGRLNMLMKMKDKVIDGFTRFTQTKNRDYGFSGKDRA